MKAICEGDVVFSTPDDYIAGTTCVHQSSISQKDLLRVTRVSLEIVLILELVQGGTTVKEIAGGWNGLRHSGKNL